jgi:hypothetical protein
MKYILTIELLGYHTKEFVFDNWKEAETAFQAASFVAGLYEQPRYSISHLAIRHVINDTCSIKLEELIPANQDN